MIYKMLNELCILHISLCSIVQFFISNRHGPREPGQASQPVSLLAIQVDEENLCRLANLFLVLALINCRVVRLEQSIPQFTIAIAFADTVIQSYGCCCRRLVANVMDLCGMRRLEQTKPFDSHSQNEGKYNQVI